VVVGFPSYARAVDPFEMIRHQHLREALLFGLKSHGFRVAEETLLPRRQRVFEYVPVRRLQALDDKAQAVIVIQVGDRVEVGIHDSSAKGPVRIRLPEGGTDFLDVAEKVCRALESGRAVTAKPVSPPDRSLRREFFSSTEPLDLGFVKRIERIQQLLGALDSGKRDLMVFAELARLHALHASYLARTSVLKCQERFGRALLFAELAVRSGAAADADFLRPFRLDVELLAKRFGAGWHIPPEHRPVLPEVEAARAFAALPAGVAPPPPARLFDFLVRREYHRYVVESDIEGGENLAPFQFYYNRPDTLDCVLILAKPGPGLVQWAHVTARVTTPDTTFYKHEKDWGPEVVKLIAVAGQDSVLTIRDAFNAVQQARNAGNDWDMLDNFGTGRRTGGNPPGGLQQAPGHGQADPFGLREGSELGLGIGVGESGAGKLSAERVGLALPVAKLVAELLELLSVCGAVGGAGHGVGLAVERLPGASPLPGQLRDGAVAPEEDGLDAGELLLGL
jgi:hypothetical protein